MDRDPLSPALYAAFTHRLAARLVGELLDISEGEFELDVLCEHVLQDCARDRWIRTTIEALQRQEDALPKDQPLDWALPEMMAVTRAILGPLTQAVADWDPVVAERLLGEAYERAERWAVLVDANTGPDQYWDTDRQDLSRNPPDLEALDAEFASVAGKEGLGTLQRLARIPESAPRAKALMRDKGGRGRAGR